MRTYSRVSSERSFWRIAVNKVVNSGSARLEIFQLEDVAGNGAIISHYFKLFAQIWSERSKKEACRRNRWTEIIPGGQRKRER